MKMTSHLPLKAAAAIVATTLLALLLCPVSSPAASQDDAIALVKQAVENVKAAGKDKAFTEFSDPKGRFVQGELYIFVVDYQGVTLAHGGTPLMVGKNMKGLKDADGNLFIQAMIDKARAGGGWVEYKWTNPATKKVQAKATYVQPIEGQDAFVGCGLYKTAP